MSYLLSSWACILHNPPPLMHTLFISSPSSPQTRYIRYHVFIPTLPLVFIGLPSHLRISNHISPKLHCAFLTAQVSQSRRRWNLEESNTGLVFFYLFDKTEPMAKAWGKCKAQILKAKHNHKRYFPVMCILHQSKCWDGDGAFFFLSAVLGGLCCIALCVTSQ